MRLFGAIPHSNISCGRGAGKCQAVQSLGAVNPSAVQNRYCLALLSMEQRLGEMNGRVFRAQQQQSRCMAPAMRPPNAPDSLGEKPQPQWTNQPWEQSAFLSELSGSSLALRLKAACL